MRWEILNSKILIFAVVNIHKSLKPLRTFLAFGGFGEFVSDCIFFDLFLKDFLNFLEFLFRIWGVLFLPDEDLPEIYFLISPCDISHIFQPFVGFLIVKNMQDILLDSRQQLKESLMLDLARDDHGNQHLMIQPEQLLNDIYLGMDKNILQQNHII